MLDVTILLQLTIICAYHEFFLFSFLYVTYKKTPVDIVCQIFLSCA